MAKKELPEERRPDLASPDQDEIEKRVKEMLEIEEQDGSKEPSRSSEKLSQPTKIEISQHTEPLIGTAPVLPGSDDAAADSEKGTEQPKQDQPRESEAIEGDETDLEPEEKIVNLDEAPKDKALIEELDEAEVEPDDSIKPDDPILEDESTNTDKTSDKTEDEVVKDVSSPVDEVINDSKTSNAVDEIIAKEGDELLDIQDQKHDKVDAKSNKKLLDRLKGFFRAWWNNPKARWITIVIVVILLALIAAIPASRYYSLNLIGFRGSVKLKVLDESTSQPLKNVSVRIANVEVKTDSSGVAMLEKIKLGASEVVIYKRAFAEVRQNTTITMGTNSVPDARLKPTGVQYSFVVTDMLSGKPAEKVEAVSGYASAISDQNGKIKLTVDDMEDKESLDVNFQKEDYRNDKITINADDKTELPVVMVPGRRHVFISKRSGTYDLYSIDVDGKNEKKIFEGTGSERDDISLATHSTSSVVALVSTREGKHNQDGFLLSTLTVVNDQSDKNTPVTTSERIQLVDWIGDDLIYVQATSGASASNPKRHRLMSYNYKTEQNKELLASNYFNDVLIFGGKIFVAPSSANSTSPAVLTRMATDGSNRVTILPQEVWSMFRTDYENVALSANQAWFNIRLGEDKATSLSTQPTNPKSRVYVNSKDNKNALWVDQRDGKGVLLNYEVSSRNEQTLQSDNGLRNPVYWLNDRVVVYRISSQEETADYAISLDGGAARKISDVSNTNSIDKWYYY